MSAPLPTDCGLALVPLLQRAERDIESTIQGRSMGNTLPPGTRILIRCREEGAYPEGSVVAFVATRGLVGHRVVGRRSDPAGAVTLLTRGDGTLVCDPPLEPGRVLGEVTAWYDGEAWHPVPSGPIRSALPRLGAAGLLLLVRAALAVDRDLATRVARIMTSVAQRLSPPGPVPLPAGSPGDQPD